MKLTIDSIVSFILLLVIMFSSLYIEYVVGWAKSSSIRYNCLTNKLIVRNQHRYPCPSYPPKNNVNSLFQQKVSFLLLGSTIREIPEPDRLSKAFPQQTPHSGRHFIPSHPSYLTTTRNKFQLRPKRFTEGWYYRLTIPEANASFAFIISIEDPGKSKSNIKLACIQVVGPDDEYIIQADNDDTKFWAWKHQQGLGYTFSYYKNVTADEPTGSTRAALHRDDWYRTGKFGLILIN